MNKRKSRFGGNAFAKSPPAFGQKKKTAPGTQNNSLPSQGKKRYTLGQGQQPGEGL